MATEPPPLRRVITGLDASGRSAFLEDGPPPVATKPALPGLRYSHAWATGRGPAPVDDPDRSPEVRGMMPPPGGSLLNIVDFPPEPKDSLERQRALLAMKEGIGKMGVNPEPGVRRYPDGPHPAMHRTDTIDYAMVLCGEIYAILENEQKLLKAGDVLIQRGTSHAWSNRSDDYCRVAFVLLEGKR